MVTGGGGGGTGGRREGGDGKTLGDGGLSPYLIPFLSTPPRSPDSGGPTLCTGGGGRRAAAANAAFPPHPPAPLPGALRRRRGDRGSRRSPRGLRWRRGWLGGRRTPGGSAGLCRGRAGGTGKRALPETVLQPCSFPSVPLSVCLPACLPGWISYLQPGSLFLLISRCLAYPRAGIDR